MEFEFDVSSFAEIGSFLLNLGREMFAMLNFNFGDFEINGLVFLIGIAVFCIVMWFIDRAITR